MTPMPANHLEPTGSDPAESPRDCATSATDGTPQGLFQPLCEDRVQTSANVVREGCGLLLDWLATLPQTTPWEHLKLQVGQGLEAFDRAHGWRAVCRRWSTYLEHLLEAGVSGAFGPCGTVTLAEELGLWLDGAGISDRPWDGTFLSDGRRQSQFQRCYEGLAGDVGQGEAILVHGYSETVVTGIKALARAGRRPRAVVSEGGPHLGGRRIARELVDAGVPVTFIYDSALLQHVLEVDHIWLGTEAIGARAFLGLRGTTALLREARTQQVPSAVLAVSEKLQADGNLILPEWAACSAWLLWGEAPRGVTVDPQAFEFVPIDLPDSFATENGITSIADLSLQQIRSDLLV